MTTVINNPGGETSTGSDSALGIIVGVIIGIVLIVLFIVYGLPALRSNTAPVEKQPDTTNINVTIPAPLAPEPQPAK